MKEQPADIKLTRIPFQKSRAWMKPTGDARRLETGTYNANYGFGHEDWLFRDEWQINGWRYSFLQGLNKSRKKYLGTTLDVALFMIRDDKRRELVGTIYEIEPLHDEKAAWALNEFKQRGWFAKMKAEIAAANGEHQKLGNSVQADHVLNIRFKTANVDRTSAGELLPNSAWYENRRRYKLYEFSANERDDLEERARQRRAKAGDFKIRTIFRPPTGGGTYTVRHDILQKRLYRLLRNKYGAGQVQLEPNYIDAVVTTSTEIILYEIKSNAESRVVIRNAIGQLLEYGFHPLQSYQQPVRLVIVGEGEITGSDATYLKLLQTRFHIPVQYLKI